MLKYFGPRGGHVEAILQPHAELAGNVDAGLVGEAHAGRQRRRLAVDQIDRLMHLHADAVAGAVRRAREACSRAHSPSFRRRRAPRHRRCRRASPSLAAAKAISWPRCIWSHTLRCSAVGRSAPHIAARNVRLVAVNRAAAVEQHVDALFDRLRLARAMRIGGALAGQHQLELWAATMRNRRRLDDLPPRRAGSCPPSPAAQASR